MNALDLKQLYAEDLIILYGGSFNPVHRGHMNVVKHLSQKFTRADLRVVPSDGMLPTNKAKKHRAIDFDLRVKFCKRALEPLSPRVTVDPIEKTLSKPCYTVELVKQFKSRFPSKKLCFVMGSDQLAHFEHWQFPKQILSMCSLLVFKRFQKDSFDAMADTISKWAVFLSEPYERSGLLFEHPELLSIYFLEADVVEVSSTQILDDLDGLADQLDPTIHKQLHENLHEVPEK